MGRALHYFANPRRFFRFAERVYPWLVTVTLLAFAAGLYFALFQSPPDRRQGETVRIMYVHVPAAWMALAVYTTIGILAFFSLVYRHRLADLMIRAAVPLGAGFTLLTLITGSLWGRPMWGTYWEWDPRMTSSLILFFLYLGLMILGRSFDEPERSYRPVAVLALIGLINVPIVKFSVDWWSSSLHQPASILRRGGVAIDGSMLLPLFIMTIAYLTFFLSLWIIRIRAEYYETRIYQLGVMAAHEENGSPKLFSSSLSISALNASPQRMPPNADLE